MRDADCVRFLQWALPRLGFRWPGFRKVRRQVCRRIQRRLRELGLADLAAYQALLAGRPEEWDRLAQLCRVTISRFFRDREVWRGLGETVLPELARRPAREGRELRVWCAGCGAGEEPYSLTILQRHRPPPGAELRVVATDLDERQLERARAAVYPASSLADLPAAWREAAFEVLGEDRWRLRSRYRRGVELRWQDLRTAAPDGPFRLVLCRNLAFTYFADELQRRVLARILARLEPGGALVLGGHEAPPGGAAGLAPWPGQRCVWRRLRPPTLVGGASP